MPCSKTNSDRSFKMCALHYVKLSCKKHFFFFETFLYNNTYLCLLDTHKYGASLVAQMVKFSACSTGDLGIILGLGRSPGKGNGYPLQYSCLENSVDRGACWTTVRGVTELDATFTRVGLTL